MAIKEKKVKINTLQSNDAEASLNINGVLKALIISSTTDAKVTIALKDYPKIILFSKDKVFGMHYLPLQTEAIAPDGQKLNFAGGHYYLNDDLIILVEGPKQSEVEIILRYM